MSKRRSLTLVVAENPNPRYPSLEAALRANCRCWLGWSHLRRAQPRYATTAYHAGKR